MNTQHTSVFLKETLDFFEGRPLKIVVDATLGGAGHAKALLKAHPEIERFIAIDKDTKALERAESTLFEWKNKVELHNKSYADIAKILGARKASAIIADLGISSDQLEDASLGISFKGDAPLDMRMDKNSSLTAEIILKTYSEKELSRIFFEYGEERRAKKLAEIIVLRRREEKIKTTKQLKSILAPFFPARTGTMKSPFTKIFQALRIETNQELKDLETFLPSAFSSLEEKGRLVVLTFHSLEDRAVKEFYKSCSKEEGLILTKKPLVPTAQEINENYRSRSAKLRALERL
jgi:16S rRNA (cytosine1402-N4)-methyltransferase